jgi:ribose transport system substrate-binding protein
MSKGRLLSILAVLTLVASNGFVAQARPAQHAARANASYTIALVQGISTDAFYVTMAKGVRAACAQLGLKAVIEGAPNFFDPQHQIPILTAVVAQHPDAILIAPTQKTSLVGPITAAAKAGIPIFEVDTYANDTVHLAYIASDNVLGGVTAAKAMNDLTGGKGSVAIINTDPGVSTVDQRVQGFVQGIKAYPGIKYLGLQYDHDQKALAAQETATLLRAHPDVTASPRPSRRRASRARSS